MVTASRLKTKKNLPLCQDSDYLGRHPSASFPEEYGGGKSGFSNWVVVATRWTPGKLSSGVELGILLP